MSSDPQVRNMMTQEESEALRKKMGEGTENLDALPDFEFSQAPPGHIETVYLGITRRLLGKDYTGGR